MKVLLSMLALLLVLSSSIAACDENSTNESCVQEDAELATQPSPLLLILLMALFTMTASFMVGREKAHSRKR